MHKEKKNMLKPYSGALGRFLKWFHNTVVQTSPDLGPPNSSMCQHGQINSDPLNSLNLSQLWCSFLAFQIQTWHLQSELRTVQISVALPLMICLDWNVPSWILIQDCIKTRAGGAYQTQIKVLLSQSQQCPPYACTTADTLLGTVLYLYAVPGVFLNICCPDKITRYRNKVIKLKHYHS